MKTNDMNTKATSSKQFPSYSGETHQSQSLGGGPLSFLEEYRRAQQERWKNQQVVTNSSSMTCENDDSNNVSREKGKDRISKLSKEEEKISINETIPKDDLLESDEQYALKLQEEEELLQKQILEKREMEKMDEELARKLYEEELLQHQQQQEEEEEEGFNNALHSPNHHEETNPIIEEPNDVEMQNYSEPYAERLIDPPIYGESQNTFHTAQTHVNHPQISFHSEGKSTTRTVNGSNMVIEETTTEPIPGTVNQYRTVTRKRIIPRNSDNLNSNDNGYIPITTLHQSNRYTQNNNNNNNNIYHQDNNTSHSSYNFQEISPFHSDPFDVMNRLRSFHSSFFDNRW